MSSAEYENRTDSVLAWKKANKLGRFDPNAPDIEQQKIDTSFREVRERGIEQGVRIVERLGLKARTAQKPGN